MSYSRKYHETITVRGSKTVNVHIPASQSSSSKTVTIEYEENVPVDVNIHVDTDPFDNSVEHCNTNVNFLTGAVVATETAQIASIDKNSKKVANTVINGFFDYIRSEISQQIAELTQNIDAQLMHLKELSKAVIEKKKQMEGDFTRISGRYIKTFDDLNNELSNRVYELDKPAFVFKKETDNQEIRTSCNDMVSTVTIFGKESGELQSKIAASLTKKRALDTLNKAKIFLWQQKKLNNTIQQSMISENIENSVFSLVSFIETQIEKTQFEKNIFTPDFISAFKDNKKKNELIEKFSDLSNTWKNIPKDYYDNLKIYFNTEINNTYTTSEQNSVRVKEMIQKIANLDSIKVIN